MLCVVSLFCSFVILSLLNQGAGDSMVGDHCMMAFLHVIAHVPFFGALYLALLASDAAAHEDPYIDLTTSTFHSALGMCSFFAMVWIGMSNWNVQCSNWPICRGSWQVNTSNV